MKAHCRTDTRLYFFSLRVLNRWNSLSQETVDACSVNAFKRQLEKIRISRMGFFMDYGLIVHITLLATGCCIWAQATWRFTILMIAKEQPHLVRYLVRSIFFSGLTLSIPLKADVTSQPVKVCRHRRASHLFSYVQQSLFVSMASLV